ncbi:Chs5p-Arf1p-binding proteins-domain-containing protein [Mycotypha africana]|uniref:Chs5p-Arf1p-binding proteins-domain-containing protein n=1 Tax=Mycotypha africana TaxID=64632 RepID=UPI0023014D25|nr:Chs5p-Arf1p-binding proteins-domain-containing protein [Mycotypha africana]KAI8975422.1 Chs5p-Arf1p-binding proteins-domain-containing protein [Mycotypha africana]
MADTLKDIPEFFETELGESIIARTNALGTFRELGPPDLCHIIKANAKPGVKEIGSYHYISGVDASSSASLAVYLNSLTYSMDETQKWFTKSNAWRIRSGIYCCFNAFAKVDVRVEVKIPGGVESYYVDVRGERHEATSDIWQETYVSAILRAILYSDDTYYRLAGYRKVDPINTLAAEEKFLEAVEALFWNGWRLGSRPEIQVATAVHNHLTDGVMKYFSDSSRFSPAIDMFQRLYTQDPEVGALLARAYLGQHEEIKAVRVLHDGLKQCPMSYPLLHAQIDFLRDKGKYDIALTLAKYAVNTTPSEYLTWAKLTEVYIDLKDYKNALLTLNSCPMFTYNERDMHRMPAPMKTHLPIKPDIIHSGILDEDMSPAESEVNSTLSRLPAPALHGTFVKAYSLLTRLAEALPWDELLRYRSEVFVMEEEYRKHKAAKDSTKEELDEKVKHRTLSSREKEASESTMSSLADAHVERPEQAAEEASQDKGSEHHHQQQQQQQQQQEQQQEQSSEVTIIFGNKRLCERWLDNLFMVLYEDLRVYTYWRAEVAHSQAQKRTYRKTGAEFEHLGDLASRLWHEKEAKEAYEACLDWKFSAKAWMKLLQIYAKEGNTQKSLLAAVKLTVYHERWYHEIVYPTEIARNLNMLIEKAGLSKMQNILMSMNLPKPVQKLMRRYFEYGELFKVEGYEL